MKAPINVYIWAEKQWCDSSIKKRDVQKNAIHILYRGKHDTFFADILLIEAFVRLPGAWKFLLLYKRGKVDLTLPKKIKEDWKI